MSNSQFDVERATAGLVTTLFLAAALLLAGLLYFVLEDIDERTAESDDDLQSVRVERPSSSQPTPTLTIVVPVS